jgi:hypothetical protein
MPTERPPLLGEVVPTFADRGCRVVSATDPPGRILCFLDRSRYYFFQVAPQLSSRGWVDPVPDPLPLRKSGSAGNRIQDLWICRQKLWPLDHRGGLYVMVSKLIHNLTRGYHKIRDNKTDHKLYLQMFAPDWCEHHGNCECIIDSIDILTKRITVYHSSI